MRGTAPIAECDVLISGAGPVALALAGRLQAQGVRCLLLEGAQTPDTRPPDVRPPDVRPIALSWGSRLLLQRLGAWQRLPADACSAIETVHVSQAGQFGQTRILASDLQQPALGYVVSYGSLLSVLSESASAVPRLQARLTDQACDAKDGADPEAYRIVWAQACGGDTASANPPTRHAIRTRLLVIAEGESANTLQRDYQQTALVFSVRAEDCPPQTAWERFTPQGPLALLPTPAPAPTSGQGNGLQRGTPLAVVWAMTHDAAARRTTLPQPVLMQELHQAWGHRHGLLQQITPCVSVPLRLSQPGQSEAAGVLRIGNAAQTLHPVAGQGFNLGLRDAWELAEAISHCGDPASLGEAAFCQRYLAARRNDRRLIVGLTDSLARGFLAQAAPLPALRGLGLAALNGLRPLRNSFARRLMHGWRALP